MNVNLHYKNQEIPFDLEKQKTEPLTQHTWVELYEKAQKQNLPYYWLSIVITKNNDPKNSNKYSAAYYDGSSLDKLMKANKANKDFLDPLRRRPILVIHNLFLNCFELKLEKNNLLIEPLDIPEISSFSFNDIHSLEIAELAKASLNVMSEILTDPSLRERIGKIQYIIGNNLIAQKNIEEAICWLAMSSKQGIPAATKLLQAKGFSL